MPERIEWIDIAKGLGMFTVIAGHTFYLGYSYPLYAFHMPLFFFLSGLVFIDKNEGFWVFLKNKAISLIKPWAIILIISFFVCLLIPQWRNALTIKSIMDDFYTANTNTLQNSSLWYLVCFYFVLLLFYIINRFRIQHSALRIILFFVFLWSLLYIKSVLILIPLPFHRLPFKIDSALVALIFFWTAYCYKSKIISFLSKKSGIMFALTLVILTTILSVFNGWCNINSLDFGRIKYLFFPIAFLGIGMVCVVSGCITKMPPPTRRFLCFYGRNSLLIFAFQSLFIRLYLLFFNNIQGLNMTLYGNNPMGHQIGSFLVVSFVMSPITIFVFKCFKKMSI